MYCQRQNMLGRSLIINSFLLVPEVNEENITRKPIWMKTYERGSEDFHEKGRFEKYFL